MYFVSSGVEGLKHKKAHSPNIFKRRCISEVVRIGLIIISHLSKL